MIFFLNWRKITIFLKFYEKYQKKKNLNFGQNFPKILIFFRIFEKSWLRSKFLKFSIAV